MLQVFLPLIGVHHIRAFRFTAAKVNHFAKDANLSINEGSQSALVAAKPFRTRSGRPFPIRRWAICVPFTWNVSTDSLGIGDVSESHNEGQGQERAAARVKSLALLADPFLATS